MIYKKVGDSNEQTIQLASGSAVSITVDNLEKFTVYDLRLLAYTIKGDGPSFDMVQMTDQDSKFS